MASSDFRKEVRIGHWMVLNECSQEERARQTGSKETFQDPEAPERWEKVFPLLTALWVMGRREKPSLRLPEPRGRGRKIF
ncbi:hypothetical protein, partial [Thermoflexus sp.]|uniref:hypothetical protein n=1 Tax=Thermoflexus sp. TaxID=1969742 RepID=UPI002ADDE6A3